MPFRATSRARKDMPEPALFSRPPAVSLDEPLLTAGQVAELLAVPRSSVYDYARRLHQPLPAITIGRHKRFLRSDIERWATRLRVD